MLAITVQQPWAWAIMHGGKNVENRTGLAMWKRAAGQRIAIHAGKRWSDRGARSGLVWQALETYGWPVGPDAANRRGLFHSGAIIGTVLVFDVHEADPDPTCCDPWGEANYVEHSGQSRDAIVHLELAAPRACEPIPARGALGLWRVPDEVQTELLEAAGR